jgi:hypothetical protein
MSGWGRTSPKQSPKYLQSVIVPIISRQLCTNRLQVAHPKMIAGKYHICAGTGNKGGCRVSKLSKILKKF